MNLHEFFREKIGLYRAQLAAYYEQESGWYVHSEGEAVAAASRYTQGVDVDAALDGFEERARAVMYVNTHHPDATGVERVALIREALRGDM